MKSNRFCTKSSIAVVFIIGLMILTLSLVFGMSCKPLDGKVPPKPTETIPPPAITGLTTTDASDTRYGKIDLTWSPSDAEDFAYYAIYAGEIEITDVTGLSPVDQITDRADVTFRVTRYRVHGLMLALVYGTEYWFAVTAVDLAGNESKVGTSISATIEMMPLAPTLPSVFIIVDYKGFKPATVTVPIGARVAWTNIDVAIEPFPCFFVADPHNVTSDTGLFHSGYVIVGDTFSYTFTQPGVFGFYDQLNHWNTGKVIVE